MEAQITRQKLRHGILLFLLWTSFNSLGTPDEGDLPRLAQQHKNKHARDGQNYRSAVDPTRKALIVLDIVRPLCPSASSQIGRPTNTYYSGWCVHDKYRNVLQPVGNLKCFPAHHNVLTTVKHWRSSLSPLMTCFPGVGTARVGHHTGIWFSGRVSHLPERPIAGATVDGTSGVIGTDGEQPPRADGHAGAEYLRVDPSSEKSIHARRYSRLYN